MNSKRRHPTNSDLTGAEARSFMTSAMASPITRQADRRDFLMRASDAGLRFQSSGLGRGRERGVVAFVLVGVALAEVGDRVVELG